MKANQFQLATLTIIRLNERHETTRFSLCISMPQAFLLENTQTLLGKAIPIPQISVDTSGFDSKVQGANS